jgi:hypothetical protein
LGALILSLALCAVTAWALPASAGTVSATYTDLSLATSIDLTAAGSLDWVKWGLNAGGVNWTPVAKSGATELISRGLTPVGTGTPGTSVALIGIAAVPPEDVLTFTWTDGTSPAAGSSDTVVTETLLPPQNDYPLGLGASMTAAASAEARVLDVYVQGFNADMQITATMSGGGSDSTVVSPTKHPAGDLPNNYSSGRYSVTFAGAGEVLTVTVRTVSPVRPGDRGFPNAGFFAATLRVADGPISLAAAVLPGSRAVQVGQAATAFATILATGPGTAAGCAIAPTNAPPGTAFSYQQTNAANVPIGTPNTPANIPGGGSQSFVFSLTPNQPFAATELHFAFDCTNTAPAADAPGVNTFLLTSSSGPTPDIVALAAAPGGQGIVTIPGTQGTGFFAVATVNVGSGGLITATADTGSAILPVALSLCQTNPVNGVCINPSAPAPSVTAQINPNETPTFAIFAQGGGTIPFNPGVNRINVRFMTQGGGTVGSTSVALRTQ